MRKRQFLTMALSGILVLGQAETALAVGPGQGNTKPEEYTQEQWDRLNDNKIEFDEISDLVLNFNPTVQSAAFQISDGFSDSREQLTELEIQAKDLEDQAKEIKESDIYSTPAGKVQYQTLKGYAAQIRSGAKTMRDALNKAENSAERSGLVLAQKSVSKGVEQLMIGYSSAAANQAMMRKYCETSQAAYEAQKISAQAGLVTEVDIMSAEAGLLTAQSSLTSLTNTVDSLKNTLCLMVGVPIENNPEIGEIPQFDMGEIDRINLEADTVKAIGNNYTLISERHSSAGKSTSAKKNRLAGMDSNEQKLTIKMQSLYQELLAQRAAYETAQISWQKANIEKEKADTSYQLGLISKIMYLQAQMGFLKSQGEYQTAYYNLYQAHLDYKWAINGIVDLS